MNPALLTTILAFVAAALAILAGYSLFRDVRQEDKRRIKRRVADEIGGQAGSTTATALFRDLKQVAAMALDDEEARPATLKESFCIMVDQSGLTLTPRRVARNSCLLGIALGVVVLVLSGVWLLAAAFLILGAVSPVAYVMFKRHQRLGKLRAQLADVFGLMGRVIRAGQTSTQAMQIVSDEFDDPVSGEFAFCQEELKLGLPVDVALRGLARRTGILEIKMFVVAMLVHQETGGNLAELLDKLSTVIRERFRIRGVIRSLTAEGRFQAAVLLALPLVLFGILFLMNPEYFGVLLYYPWVLLGAFVSELIGALWIRRIINFDI